MPVYLRKNQSLLIEIASWPQFVWAYNVAEPEHDQLNQRRTTVLSRHACKQASRHFYLQLMLPQCFHHFGIRKIWNHSQDCSPLLHSSVQFNAPLQVQDFWVLTLINYFSSVCTEEYLECLEVYFLFSPLRFQQIIHNVPPEGQLGLLVSTVVSQWTCACMGFLQVFQLPPPSQNV